MSLSCCEVKFLFILSVLAEALRFLARIDGYLELFIIPFTLIKTPIPAEEKQPQSMMRSPSCLTVGMVFIWSCDVGFIASNIYFGITAQVQL